MNCKVEKTKNANEAKLEITVEAEKFNEAIKKVYTKNSKYFLIPGFRKGKAPQNIVEKYYGKEIFYEDAFNEIAGEEYEKAAKESKLEIVSKPKIDIVTMEKGKDLVFTAIVATKPEVELGEYKGIEIEKIEYIVKDEDVEAEIKKMQEKNSRMVSIETPVESGNTAVIDFDGYVDGVAFDGGKAENHSLEIGSGTFIPGFEDQIIGMKIDEEKEIEVKFPDDYYSKELAGKNATFKVKVKEIKKKELPELDDEFAKDVSEFDTLQELKNSIKEKLVNQNMEKEKYEKEDAVVKKVVENMKVEIPQGMIELEKDEMFENMKQRIEYQGMKMDLYLKYLNKTEEEYKKEFEPQAIEAIKSRLALEKVAELEKIEASEREIKDKIEEMAKNYGKEVKELEENENINTYIKQGIINEKAIEFLVQNSKQVKKEEKKTEKKETKKATK